MNTKTFIAEIGKSILIVFIFILSSATLLNAQEREQYEIYSLGQIVDDNALRSTLPNYIKPENINPLIRDLVPSVYMVDGSVNFYGDKPVRAYLDLNAMRGNIARQPRFDNVEIVVVQVSGINEIHSLNLDNLAGFVKLKYVYIVCNGDCNESQMRNSIVQLANNNRSEKDYVIIYNVEKQS